MPQAAKAVAMCLCYLGRLPGVSRERARRRGWTPVANRTAGQRAATSRARAASSTSPAARTTAPRSTRPLRPRVRAVHAAGKYLVGEVAVRIDHRIREPGRFLRRTPRAPASPPSGLAARIMPFDSMPISLAGFRLKTTPTVFPTNCSASYASAIPATSVRCSVPTSIDSFISFFEFGLSRQRGLSPPADRS